jgi:DNA-binding NarL/FixJ family response regulator
MLHRILIIDDDDYFRSAQKRMIHRMKFSSGDSAEIIEAASGNEGMTKLAEQEIDCVLLDHDMPGGSGIYWLQKIVANSPNQAIVMLTGHGSEQLAVDAMKNGAMDYLVKGSITPEEMERAILNAVEKVELRKTVEKQREQLLDAERHRVMIEALGTACHHLGQPATVLSAYLEMMEQRENDVEMMDMIEACKEASDSMNQILQRLLQVSQYRTAPYLPGSAGEPEGKDQIIAL